MDAIFNLDESQQVTVCHFQQEPVEEQQGLGINWTEVLGFESVDPYWEQGLKPDLVDFDERQEQKQEEEEGLAKHVGAGTDDCSPDLNLGEQEKPVSITIDLGVETSDLKSGVLESSTGELGLESPGSDDCSPNLNSGVQQTHERGRVSSSYDLGLRSTGSDDCSLNLNSDHVVEKPGRGTPNANKSVSSSDDLVLESTGSVGCSRNQNSGGWQKPKRGRPPKANNKHDSKDPGRQVVLALPVQVTNVAVKRLNLTIAAGEDVCAAIFSAFQPPDQVVWIVSASGTVSSVRLRGEAPDDVIAFQGSYSIRSLSGPYVSSWYSASHIQMRDLGVTLVGVEDGTVIGGRVTAPLTAESPVQVVLGRYINNTHN